MAMLYQVEHGPGVCDAPTILEREFTGGSYEAINDVLEESQCHKQMEVLLEQTVIWTTRSN